jgi:hypothetical protein
MYVFSMTINFEPKLHRSLIHATTDRTSDTNEAFIGDRVSRGAKAEDGGSVSGNNLDWWRGGVLM